MHGMGKLVFNLNSGWVVENVMKMLLLLFTTFDCVVEFDI